MWQQSQHPLVLGSVLSSFRHLFQHFMPSKPNLNVEAPKQCCMTFLPLTLSLACIVAHVVLFCCMKMALKSVTASYVCLLVRMSDNKENILGWICRTVHNDHKKLNSNNEEHSSSVFAGMWLGPLPLLNTIIFLILSGLIPPLPSECKGALSDFILFRL